MEGRVIYRACIVTGLQGYRDEIRAKHACAMSLRNYESTKLYSTSPY